MGRYLRLNIPIAFAIFLSFLVWSCHGYCFQEVSSITGSDWMKSWPPDVSIVDLVKQMIYKGVVLGNSSLVPVLWSLRIEFLGSVVLLTYLILTSPSSQYLAVVYAVVIYFVFKQEAFFHLLFLGGMLIGFRGKDGESLLLSNRKVGLVSVAVGILIGGYMQGGIYKMLPVVTGYWVPFWNMSVFWHGIGAVLVVFGVTRGAFSTFLQGDFVLFLGKVSFSLYLVHMIVMGSIVSRLFLWLPRNPFVLLLEFLIYLAICFSASWLFCRYIDKFSLKLSHAFAKAVV
jgi:peptidoglycan/LPS O-acetylase OafA/YrhL